MSAISEALGLLGKVKFIFYDNPEVPGIGIPFQPAYNPTSFSVSHSSGYDDMKKPVDGDMSKKFTALNPRSVSMELFFDGTGASPSATDLTSKATSALGLPAINTVDIQIKAFLNLAYKINGPKHVPRYVMIVWGTFIMTGVLASANVTYKMFAPSGRPLRATMSITINEYVFGGLLSKINKLLSPDLSKAIIVKEGDTLSLLCHQEYGDASLYTKVAEVNKLKNYRRLKQGMELLFPPIDNLV
jgi:hypothetical protein